MILSKILSKYQITLPKEAVQMLHLHKGDVLKCKIEKDTISFMPVVVEEPYSEEDLQKFHDLYNHPKNKGKVYHTTSEAMGHLRRLHAPD